MVSLSQEIFNEMIPLATQILGEFLENYSKYWKILRKGIHVFREFFSKINSLKILRLYETRSNLGPSLDNRVSCFVTFTRNDKEEEEGEQERKTHAWKSRDRSREIEIAKDRCRRGSFKNGTSVRLCCCSYEAEGALGRDELENDAEEDGVGRDARRQSAIRGEKERGGGLVGANGNSAGENAGRRAHCRCSRGAAPGTKGTLAFFFLS